MTERGRTPAPELSLAAELLVSAIDPSTGRLRRRRRRRFRRALALAAGMRGPLAGWRARRAAVRELRAVGIVGPTTVPGRYAIVAGSGHFRPLGRVRRAIETGEFTRDQDVALFALLAWTGVLAGILGRSERTTALKRLRKLLEAPPAESSVFDPISPLGDALGRIVHREQSDLFQEMLGDLLGGDGGGDFGGGGDGGGDGGGGGGGGD